MRRFLIGAGIAVALTAVAVGAIYWGTSESPSAARHRPGATGNAPAGVADAPAPAPAAGSNGSWWQLSSPAPQAPTLPPGTNPHLRGAPPPATGPEPTGRQAPPPVVRRDPRDPLPPEELRHPDYRKRRVTAADEGAEYNRSP